MLLLKSCFKAFILRRLFAPSIVVELVNKGMKSMGILLPFSLCEGCRNPPPMSAIPIHMRPHCFSLVKSVNISKLIVYEAIQMF